MKILSFIVNPVIYALALVFPKDKSLWCFGAWFGQKYADNSRYLYEQALKLGEELDIQAVWITADAEIFEQLSMAGSPVCMRASLRGIWTQLRAGTFVCTVNSKDFLFPVVTPRSRFIQLWHGSPIKKIGFDRDGLGSAMMFKERVGGYFFEHYSLMVSPAKVFDAKFSSAFGLDSSQIIRSGYPRNDGLFRGQRERESIREALGVKSERFYMYLPTHRKEGTKSGVLSKVIEELSGCASQLQEADLTVIIKPHFYDLEALGKYETTEGAVRVCRDLGGVELYEALGATDGLITDYSSVVLDYDVLEKTLFFFAPDLEEYLADDRDMYFQYHEIVTDYHTDVNDLVDALCAGQGSALLLEANEDKREGYSSRLLDALV